MVPEKALFNSYGIPGSGSMLEFSNLQAYNLKGDYIKNLNTNRVQIFNNRVKTKNPKDYNDKPIIHFDPEELPTEALITKTLNTRATQDQIDKDVNAAPEDKASAWSHLTRHRLVTCKVTSFGDGFGKELDPADADTSNHPFPIILTTGCGINLMNTTSTDFKYFQDNGYLQTKGANRYALTPQGESYFKDQMVLLFKRMLWAQGQAGVQVCILPMFNGGVYLKLLEENSKNNAKNLIHSALKEAVETLERDKQLGSITEIIYSIPDSKNNNGSKNQADFNAANTILNSFNSPAGKTTLTLTNADIFNAAHYLTDAKKMVPKKVGVINPGSNRTIGGAYLETLNVSKKDEITPLEETICNLTDAVSRQAIDQEPYKNQRNKYTGAPFPANLLASAVVPSQPTATTNPATANPATNPNAAALQTPSNINLLSTWAIRAMQQRTTEWQALNLKTENGVITGHSAKGSTISITKNAMNFSFKNINEEKDTIRQSLRLLIAATKDPNSTATTRLPISFTGSEEVQAVLKSICREPEFARFFDMDGTQPQQNPAPTSTTQPTPASSAEPENAGEPLDDVDEPFEDDGLDDLRARLNNLKGK